MKIHFEIQCNQCQEPIPIAMPLNATFGKWKCPQCEANNNTSINVQLGARILHRSYYELVKAQDYSMSIVLAAMAMDCELSRLFLKWKGIESYLKDGVLSPDQEKIEKELRNLRIDRKIETVSKLLTKLTIDEFVLHNGAIKEQIDFNFKSIKVGTLAVDFQQHLFWPRNKILHWGYAQSTHEDAAKCYSFAQLGLFILHRMDEQRQTTT